MGKTHIIQLLKAFLFDAHLSSIFAFKSSKLCPF